MEEVPGSKESLLALDEQPALTGQNEEVVLIRLGVVDAALGGLEDPHIDPELRELDRRLAVLVGEPTRSAPRLRREPLGIAHVDDKPPLVTGASPEPASSSLASFTKQSLAVQATAVSSGPVCGNVTRTRLAPRCSSTRLSCAITKLDRPQGLLLHHGIPRTWPDRHRSAAARSRGNALRGAEVTETGSSRKRAIHLADSCWEYPETCLCGLRHTGWMRLAAH